MKKISSNHTKLFKYGFPSCFIFILINVAIFTSFEIDDMLIFSILALVICYRTVLDLVDEVWADDQHLILKDLWKEDRIPYSNIDGMKFSLITYPERVTILLNCSSKFGKSFVFSPPASTFHIPFDKTPIGIELSEKISRYSH